MRSRCLPSPRLASTFFDKSLMLLAGALVGLSPLALTAQSVTFSGAQTTLPFTGAGQSTETPAVDSVGNVFVADSHRIVEVQKTSTGYRPQIDAVTGLPFAVAVAADPDGNLFVVQPNEKNELVELRKTATGFAAPKAVPVNGLSSPSGIAIDGAGNVFIADTEPVEDDQLVELPKTATGYGPQTSLPINYELRGEIAVDLAGDVFVIGVAYGHTTIRVAELPKTATGWGELIPLPTVGLNPTGFTVDNAGNVFIADGGNYRTLELPKTATGYGPQVAFPLSSDLASIGVGADTAGNLLITTVIPGTDTLGMVEYQRGSVYFGSAYVCGSGTTPAPCSQTLPLTYSVIDSATLGTPKVLTGGMPNLDFTLASGSSCSGSVSGGTACTVNVTFTPQAAGARNGTVEIVDGSGNVITTTTISGSGLANVTGSPVAQVSTNLLQFNTAAFGSTPNLPLTVTNIGGGTLIVAPTINGQSFTIAGSTCAAGLAAGKSCTLQVEFSPVVVGPHNDVLTVLTNGETNSTVQLQGVASGVTSAIRVLNFGTIPADTTSVIPLTITNVGVPGTVTIGTAISGNSFTILTTAQNTCLAGIASGQNCVLPVEYLHTSVGAHNEQLTLTPSGGAAASVIHLDGVEAAP